MVGKRGSETMEMKVSCDSSGLWVTPSSLTPYAENGMRIAFERVLETSRASRPATGLEVSAELVRGPEGKLYFPSGLNSFAMAAVRLRVAGYRFFLRSSLRFAEIFFAIKRPRRRGWGKRLRVASARWP